MIPRAYSTVDINRLYTLLTIASVRPLCHDISLYACAAEKEVEVLAKSMGVCQLVDTGKPDAKKTPSPNHDWIHVDCCNDEIFNYCQVVFCTNLDDISSL